MTNEEFQFKLQAYLDGELPPGELEAMTDVLVKDAGARALLSELKTTRNAVKGNELEVKVPDSREFYWSRIKQQIEREETKAAPVAEPSFFAKLQGFLMPAAGFAAVALLAIVGLRQFEHGSGTTAPAYAQIHEHESAEAEAVTFQDHAEGMTVVWLSYNDDKGFTEESSLDTLQ